MTRFSRAACAAALAATLWPTAGAAAAPAPSTIPVAAFFNSPDMSEPVISPDGDALAVLVRNTAGLRQLAIIDTADLHKVQIAAGFIDADISDVAWADDKRLVFRTWHEDSSAGDQTGSGLFAVDRDGTDLRSLIAARTYFVQTSATGVKSHELSPDHHLVRTLADGTGDVIIERVLHTDDRVGAGTHYHIEVTGTVPLRLDTRTGRTRSAIAGEVPDHAFEWFFDERGQLLGVETENAGETAILAPDAAGHLRERARFPTYGATARDGAREPGYSLHSVTTDGQVYVTQYSPGPDGVRGLYRLDLQTGQPEPLPTVSLKGFDFRGTLIEDRRQHKVLGVHYTADAAGTVWFDPSMTALQAKIDARLPGLINIVDLASCGCANRVLVTSHSDRQPALFFLYDRTLDALIEIGNSRPAIVRSQMSDTDFVRIKARDGQEIPVYVTKPHGKGPWPTVILVHGGPQVRGWTWKWDPESQFFASRGYLVVKPEYRGSEGYGRRLFRSGFKQWGLKSQDDIADATRWAADQGLEDPARTCIAGASYGGYATLMGLVRYPELYRCGVAWAAVADIDMMYETWWSDMGDEWKGYGMPVMIGDRVKDAAQLAETSPLRQAARITRPLLLAHGGVDRRVPVEQAYAMRDALNAHHAPLTWILYPDEAHGWYKPETRAAFYAAMAKFLDANIGAGAPTSQPAP